MGLADTLATPPRRARKGPQCLTCRLAGMLTGDEQVAFRAAVADPRWESKALADAMQAEGFDLTEYSIARHRRRVCVGAR